MPRDYEPFKEVPEYDIVEDYASNTGGCAKCFVVDRTMVYSAAVQAVMDGGEARELRLNAFETDPYALQLGARPWPEVFASIFDEEGRTTWFDLPPVPVNGEAVEIGIVDIVTFPFFYGIVHQIDRTPELLWQINHNILAPFVDGLTGWAGVWSAFHWNEEPIDDAPAHNLVVFARDLDAATKRSEVEKLLARIPSRAAVAVTARSRVMDSRCNLLRRRPEDAPARPLEVMSAGEVVPQMMSRLRP